MLLVVGLGNPGARYEATRHNIGFRVARAFIEHVGAPAPVPRHRGLLTSGRLGGAPVAVLMPQTYMNASGESVAPVAAELGVAIEQIAVVHDELDLPAGTLRLKRGGGDGGHNGLKSLTRELGSADYLRLRVGIGRPPSDFEGSVADYVLQAFALAEQDTVSNVVLAGVDALQLLAQRGPERTMNHVNRRKPAPTSTADSADAPERGSVEPEPTN